MPIAMEIFRQLMRASYSALLFVDEKSNIIAIWNEWPSGLTRTTHAPDLLVVVDPSMCSFLGG